MIVQALLLALSAPAAAPDPAPVRAALRRATEAVERAQRCARGRDARDRAHHIEREAFALESEAGGIFGRRAVADMVGVAPGARCGNAADEPLATARARLDEAAAALAEQRARMPGLWFGTVRVCGASTPPAADTADGTIHEFVVTLPIETHRAFAAMTAARVGENMSVRLDGREIMAPHVNEPITGGAVQIAGGHPELLEASRAAVARPCR